MNIFPETSYETVTQAIPALDEAGYYLQPNVQAHIHFSAHATAEDLGDMQALHARIAQADIVLLEQGGWNEHAWEPYQAAAYGDIAAYQRVLKACQNEGNRGFDSAVLHALYNTQVHIGMLDVPKDNPLRPHILHLQGLDQEPEADDGNGDFESYIEFALAAAAMQVPAEEYRERHMVASVQPWIDHAIQNNPGLASKQHIRVLTLLGTFHTGVFHHLQAIASPTSQVTRSFSEPLVVFTEHNQMVRSDVLSAPLDQDTKRALATQSYMSRFARLLIQQFVQHDYIPPMPRYQEIGLARSIARSFTLQDIAEHYNRGQANSQDPFVEEINRRVTNRITGQ